MLDSNQELAYRIESSQTEHQLALTTVLRDRLGLATAQALPLLGGHAIFHGSNYPTNHGLGMGFHEDVSEEGIDHLEQFYGSQGVPVTIEVCPFVAPAFMQMVGKRAYTVVRFYNTYVRPLAREVVSDSSVTNVLIHQARATESNLWAQTVAGTSQPDAPVLRLAQATFHTAGVQCLIASLDGVVAGGGAVAMLGDIAYLTFMATQPLLRQRGVQQALLSERLAAAARAGCTLAICHTVPGSQSQRNVLRAGFELAYTKVFLQKDVHL